MARFGRGIIRSRIRLRNPLTVGTKFYLHDAVTTVTGTMPGTATLSTAGALGPNFAGEAVNRDATTTIGVGPQIAPSGSVVNAKSALTRRFITRPLAAQTIPEGPWQLNIALATTGGGPAFISSGVWRWRPSDGTSQLIYDDGGTGIGGASTTNAGETAVTATVSNLAFITDSVTLLDGDVLVIEIYVFNNAASTQTITMYYDGTTEGSSSTNAANLVAPVVLTFSSAPGIILRLLALTGVGV